MSQSIILKKVKENFIHRNGHAQEIIDAYAQKLIQDGWHEVPIESAVISEDGLAIFYHFRNPYRGQMERYADDFTTWK